MFRVAVPALIALGLAAPLQALDLNAMSAEERDAFRAEVRNYLMEHPEIIFEAVQAMEDRQAEAQAEADFSLVDVNRDAIFDDGFSHVAGNPEGDITLVEFTDYRCPYCRKATPEIDKLLEQDGNIRFIIKEFPILGEASLTASRFAIATRQIEGGEAYEQVHDALMAMNGEPDEARLRKISDDLGLDTDTIIKRMDSDEVNNEIIRTRELAQRLQISGTPTFVLVDEMLRGFVPAEQLAEMVAEKRERDQ